MFYYWLNSIDLEPGSVINPGTWSRIISLTPGHGWALLEEVYERVRRDQFSHLPSRRKSVFVFNQKDRAMEFRDSKRLTDLVYKVESVGIDGEIKNAILDMSIVNPDLPNVRPLSISELEEQALRYWRTSEEPSQQQLPEVLLEESIRILSKVA